jgi:DNA-binding CsgD family transcriptional regulator
VERGDAIGQIDALLAAIGHRDGRTLVLDAMAGLGKSALLEHASRAGGEAGVTVLRARGDELGRHVPYGVLQQLLMRLIRELGTAEHTPLAGSPVQPLLAAIGVTALAAPITPGQVATGLWWLLDTLTDERRILLIVDDLQSVDRPSLVALAFLAARIDGTRCSMLVAQRTGASCEDDGAGARLRHAAATRITSLPPLSSDGAAEVARSIQPALTDDEVLAAFTATGGNPFLLTELVAHQTPEQFDDQVPYTSDVLAAVPPRVLDHVRLRLAHGGDGAAQIGAATAVLGQWATVGRIASVAQLSCDHVAALVDELVDGDVLVRDAERCWFRHPLLRAAMLGVSVDDCVRRQLSRRAAETLASDNLDAMSVASVLLDAPVAHDPWTSAHLIAGAAAAMDAGAPADAVRFLDRAIAEPIDDDAARARAWNMIGRARVMDGDPRGAIAAMHAALDLMTDPSERSTQRAAIANTHIAASDLVGAMRAFDAAACELDDTPGSASRIVMLRASAASFGRFLGRSGDSEDPLQHALPQDPADDTHEHRILLANVALAHVFANDHHGRVCELARRALTDTKLLREVTSDAKVFYVATASLLWSDAYDEVMPMLDAALDDARRRGSVLGHATASASRGGALYRSGDLVRAAAELESANDAREDGWSISLAFTLYYAAQTYLELGDPTSAIALVEASIDGDDLTTWGPVEPFAHAALGVAAHARGDDHAAFELFLRAVEAERLHGAQPIGVADWRHDAIEFGARVDRRDEVATLAAETLDRARAFGAPRALALALGGAAAVSQDDTERRCLLDEALDILDGADIPLTQARTLVRRGELELERANPTGAQVYFQRALAPAERCRARVLLGVLATHGVMPRAARAHDLLTPGEVRTVELALSGLTNREIAQTLFVTVKAVEWHLSNAYRKLGVRGRDGLANAY